MSLDFSVDAEIAKVDDRSADEIKAASEGLPLAQYRMNKWFNERRTWLEFCIPRRMGFFECTLEHGFSFKCLNCRKKKFEVVGAWFNPSIGKVVQLGPPFIDHGIYRCVACGCIRNARGVAD